MQRLGRYRPLNFVPMLRKTSVKTLSAAAMLVGVLALTACNRGYGCPSAIKADVGQPAAVK